MAGKTNTSATYFAQKKLLGKAHTSNLKTDGEELIGSNIQTATSLVFGEKIPLAPERTLYLLQSASNDDNATVEYIQFNLDVLTGTTYDANNTNPDGGAGSDSGESSQVSGPHTYKFRFPSDYSSSTSNPRLGNGFFENSKLVHETLGTVQLVPPFFSQAAPNPYIVKIYQDDGGGGVGSEIPLLDNIDWNVDFYNGILFLQDYNASKIPAFARAFAYVGKMADEVIASGSGGSGSGGGSGDAGAEYVLTTATGSLPNAKVIEAGTGVTIVTGSNSITISASTSAINGREKTTYFVTSSHSANSALVISGPDFSTVQYDTNKIDINLNGQLLHTGSSAQVTAGERDYYLYNTGSIVFGFDLEADDIVDTIISVVGGGSGGGAGETAASYLVLSNTGSLSNERAFVAGTGLAANDSGANGNYTLSINDSVVATLTSSAVFSNGISGSLTQLADGTSYLIAGDNITISSASNGAITINSIVPTRDKEIYSVSTTVSSGSAFSTSNSNYQDAGFKSNLIDVFLNGQLLMSGTDAQVGVGSVDYFVSSFNELKFGFDLSPDDIVNVMVTPTGSSGGSGGSGGSGTEYTAGTGLILNGTEFSIDDSVVTTLTSSATFTNGLSGSLTQLSDGSSYLIAGSNVTIASASNSSITISSTDTNTTYTAGTGLNLSSTEFSINDSIVATLTSSAKFSNGLSGSLTQLTDGSSYLVAGSNVTITSASNGQISIAASATGTTEVSEDTSPVLGGQLVTGDYKIAYATGNNTSEIDFTYNGGGNFTAIASVKSIDMFLDLNGGDSGQKFRIFNNLQPASSYAGGTNTDTNAIFMVQETGNVLAKGYVTASMGFSGSLTQLTDGSSYLIAGSNVTITSASNGAITISATDTDTNTTYTAGDGLSLVGTEFSVASSIAGAGLTESSGVLSVVNGTNGGLFVDTNSVSLNLANLSEATVNVASDSIAFIDADGFTTRRETIADFIDATAGTGINATSGVLSINDSVVATISGSQFSGNVGITGSLGVESTTIFNGGIHENFETKSSATGVVTHDCSTGHIFFHSGSTSNFTANFTNLNLSAAYATNLTLLVTQSATAYIPSAVQIEGSAQTLMWQGGSAPSGTSNGQDVVSFSILNNSGSYVVLGQLVGFG